MFKQKQILPKDSGGWEKINNEIINDPLFNNPIELATRILVSVVFNSDPKTQLETNIIMELSKHVKEHAKLILTVFKTAKMYGACMHDYYLLNGLYSYGKKHDMAMQYAPSDYFYDERLNSLVLDTTGELKRKERALIREDITNLLNEAAVENDTDDPALSDVNNIPEKESDDEEANRLIEDWKSKMR